MRIFRYITRFILGGTIVLVLFANFDIYVTSGKEVGNLEVYLGLSISSLVYALYQFYMAYHELYKKHVKNWWFYSSSSFFPLAIVLILVGVTINSNNLTTLLLPVYIIAILIFTLHIFDFFYYQSSISDGSKHFDDVIDF